MNDTQTIVVGGAVSAWLTLEAIQLWIGLAVAVLTVAVLIQRLVINYRDLKIRSQAETPGYLGGKTGGGRPPSE